MVALARAARCTCHEILEIASPKRRRRQCEKKRTRSRDGSWKLVVKVHGAATVCPRRGDGGRGRLRTGSWLQTMVVGGIAMLVPVRVDGQGAGRPATCSGATTLCARCADDPVRPTTSRRCREVGATDPHRVRAAARAVGQRGTGADARVAAAPSVARRRSTPAGPPKLVQAVVKRLRRKLGDDAANPAYILNERGGGYFMPPVSP